MQPTSVLVCIVESYGLSVVFLPRPTLPFRDRLHQSNSWQFSWSPSSSTSFAVRRRGNLRGNISISNLYWMFLLSFWFPPKDIGAAVLSRQNNLISRATRPAFSSKDKWISQPHGLYFPLADIRIFSGRQIQIYLSVEIEIGWTRARTEKFYQSSHSSLLSWNDVWNLEMELLQ